MVSMTVLQAFRLKYHGANAFESMSRRRQDDIQVFALGEESPLIPETKRKHRKILNLSRSGRMQPRLYEKKEESLIVAVSKL